LLIQLQQCEIDHCQDARSPDCSETCLLRLPSYFLQEQIERYQVPLKFEIAFDRKTFHRNFLPGTPSWVVFDQDCNMLVSWFGHKSEEEVESILGQHLRRTTTHQQANSMH
ncbi:MAG: hypothetical protein AAFX51_08200, partial [Cyanobacteria bacterium J06636_28]